MGEFSDRQETREKTQKKMRRALEKLARLLAHEPGEITMGELAKKHGETVERIMDASDMLKLLEAMGARP